MTDVWILPHVSPIEKEFGYHPTQKPLQLLERIILSCAKPYDLVLDPFNGSGTTSVAAIKNNRRFIGIENNKSFFEISSERVAFLQK
ncbi:MAG TPA: site-specific DNA-methyltransferase [Bacillus bacterium]|nr:site-specific DNA-methyltransferase [Bacillus sp. (in: firmicutes)]